MLARSPSRWPAASGVRVVVAIAGVATALGPACAGRRTEVDARVDSAPRVANAQVGDAATDAAPIAPQTGDLEVRVRWPHVPPALLGPGELAVARACGAPAPRGVQINADFAVQGVFIAVQGAAATTTDASHTPVGETRLLLGECDPAPTALVGSLGDLLLYNRGVARAVRVRFSPWSLPPTRGALRFATKAAAGEVLLMALGAPGVYRVETATSKWSSVIVVPGGDRVVTTDEHGMATLGSLPVGTHRVVAWLPGASDDADQVASATVVITPGATATASLQFGPP